MSSYPKWLYHSEKEPRVVADVAAHQALGAGWVESPALLELKPKTEKKPGRKAD